MTHHPIYETYLSEMKRLGATPPYMSEAQVLESAGIVIEEEEVHTPFISRKKESFRNVEPTLSNHEAPVSKTPLRVNLMDAPKMAEEKTPPKPRAARQPRPKKPKKPPMTLEEKRAYKTTYMKKYRELHPSLAYQSVKKWREDHPEENRKRRREEASRRRARKKNSNEVIL